MTNYLLILQVLYLSGTPSLKNWTSPPSYLYLDNHLYMIPYGGPGKYPKNTRPNRVKNRPKDGTLDGNLFFSNRPCLYLKYTKSDGNVPESAKQICVSVRKMIRYFILFDK